MSTTDLTKCHIPKDEGETISFMGMDLVWKIKSDTSSQSFLVFVQVGPPGTGVPLHIHHDEDENVYLIDGELVFQVEDRTFDAKPGDMVYLPKGAKHGFRITGDKTAQVLFTLDLSHTSDYEAMFDGLVGLGPEDFEQVKAVCAANNVEFLAPPSMP